ncbi:hypothetical protein GCM10009789_37020 [Kribbella sancticallisti]|uniref:Uncharacterized protein n=1 Tax=Kribbella sancticallisti TaxID=460087 RepID=A0ABP4PG88_9ACTN
MANWDDVLRTIAGPTVLTDRIPGIVCGGLGITPDWLYVDLIIHPRVDCWLPKNERVALACESGKNAHRPRNLAAQLEKDLAGQFAAGTPVGEFAAK